MLSPRTTGLLVGFAFGVVWMWLGFGPAVLAGFLGLLGWFVGSVVASAASGRLDLATFWNDVFRGGRTSP
ncbi:MAG TPA: hypothetical protein VF040_03225 [Ktedonobacterales bacterium]